MKKLFILPVALAACSFAFLPTNNTVEANAEELRTLSINLLSLNMEVGQTDVSASLAPVKDIDKGFVTYGFTAGNPETGTFTQMVKHPDGWWQNDFYVDGVAFVDWNGTRCGAWNGNYLILTFTAVTRTDFSVEGQPWGSSQESYIKYFETEADYDFTTPLTPVKTTYRAADGNWSGLAYTTTLEAGESFVWAYGGSTRETTSMEVLQNVVFKLNELPAPEPEPDVVKTATLTAEDLFYKPVTTNNGADLTTANGIATYGSRFGLPTDTNPYSAEPIHETDGYICGGTKHYWYKYRLLDNNGFAYRIEAHERMTVNFNWANHDGSYLTDGYHTTHVRYLIVRNNEVIKTVYTSPALGNTYAENADKLNCPSLIELLPGDAVYCGFNTNKPDGFLDLNLANYSDITVTLTTVLLSDNAKAVVNDWFALRAANTGSLCELSAEDSAKLQGIIDAYYALSEEEQAIVGRTLDTKGFTLSDSIAYFEAYDASLASMNFINVKENSYIIILIAAGALSVTLVAVLLLKKRKVNK